MSSAYSHLKIYQNGAFVPWDDAKVHVYSPCVKYAAAVFEGIRGYWNAEQEKMHVFRLREHAERLAFSQRALRFKRVFQADEVVAATLALLRENGFRETVHIRPTAYIDGFGDNAAREPVCLCIAAVPRPAPKRLESGCRVQVSSWQRITDMATPPRVKANANYNNARLGAVQAQIDGYDTALFLNRHGKVSEGPSMCFFMVRRGIVVTPSSDSDILESITRDTIIRLCRDRLGLPVEERPVDRSELLDAEEAFFCGTGWEVTPIVDIDGVPVGDGRRGPRTKRLQDTYFDLVYGRGNDRDGWLTTV
jgi:branched-chain amino acid aminotransferase